MKYTTSYTFTTNMGNVTFSASGDYYNPVPSRDIDVQIENGEYREFTEIDEKSLPCVVGSFSFQQFFEVFNILL